MIYDKSTRSEIMELRAIFHLDPISVKKVPCRRCGAIFLAHYKGQAKQTWCCSACQADLREIRENDATIKVD